jgi:hypothetical protein
MQIAWLMGLEVDQADRLRGDEAFGAHRSGSVRAR